MQSHSIIITQRYLTNTMEKLKFKVGNLTKSDDADFSLVAYNSWNDYGYETLYIVYALPSITKGRIQKIGHIKIGTCKKDVASKNLLINEMGNSIWSELPYEIVTSCRDVNLCKFLRDNLTYELRQDFIHSLHLIMGEDAYLERIKSSRVFISSMRRDITLEQYLEHIKQIRDIMITNEKDSFSQYHEGNIVKCTITSIDGDFIQVNLDDTSFGKVLRSEVRIRNLEVGMELEFYIVEMGNDDQQFKLSWELAQKKKGWHNLINALETGIGLLGKIKSLSVDNTNFMVSMHHNLVFLPLSECTRKMQENPLQYIDKTVTAKVIEIDEPNEKCIVSVSSYNYDKKQKRNQLICQQIQQIREGDVGEAIVLRISNNENTPGFIVDYKKVEVFIPYRAISRYEIQDPESYIGNLLQVKVLGKDIQNGKVLLSHIFLEEERAKEEFFKTVEIGNIYQVRVVKITGKGVIVDLGANITGYIPNREISWGYVSKPEEYVNINDSFQAAIIAINQEAKTIVLSRNKCQNDPWQTIHQKYQIGLELEGVVKNKLDYGTFIELEEGIVGLLPKNLLTWDVYRNEIEHERINIGDKIQVTINIIDVINKKIELSKKVSIENPWPKIKEKYLRGDEVVGIVISHIKDGLYVELEPRVGGLISSNEYNWPGEPFYMPSVGDTVRAKVIRISGGMMNMSIKRLTPNPLAKVMDSLPNPVEVVVKEIDESSQEILVECNNYLGYARLSDLIDKGTPIRERTIKVGQRLSLRCYDYGNRFLKFTRSNLMANLYGDEHYSCSQEDLLRYMDIQSTEFFGKVCKLNNSLVVEELIVAPNHMYNNEDRGRLLADPLSGKNIIIEHINSSIKDLHEGKYYRIIISAVDETVRRKLYNPFTFEVQKVIEEVSNPYEDSVKRSFTKHNSPSSNTSIAHLLNEVGENLYTGKKRMFYELLQNADDSSADMGVQFSVETDGDYLIIAHDGRSFNQNDFDSIISAARSTKSASRKKTGYKGIGFKSVFTNTSKVLIKTGGYYFSFDSNHSKYQDFKEFYFDVAKKNTPESQREFLLTYDKEYRDFQGARDIPWQLLPIWEETIPIELQETLFNTNANVAIAIKKNSIDIMQVEESIKEILRNPIFMLFLRHAKRVQYQTNGEYETVTKRIHKGVVKITSSLSGKEKNKAEYELSEVTNVEVSDSSFNACGIPLRKGKELIPGHEMPSEILEQYNREDPDGQVSRVEVPDRIASATETTITFAAQIVKGRVCPLENNVKSLYAYLPLEEKELTFRLYVNADFVPTSDREGVQSNNPWNWFLFYNIGKKLVGEVAKYATIKNTNYLNLLQDKLFDNESSPLASHFNRGYKEALLEESFILGEDLQKHKQSEIVIDKTGLSQIVGSMVFYQITGTKRILPSFKIDTKILMDNCEVDDSIDDKFALFDSLEVIHLEDILSNLSNNEDFLAWFKGTDEISRAKFYRWIVTHKLQALASSLPIFTYGEEQLTREEIDSKSAYIISTETTQDIQAILTKIGVKCSNEVWSKHPLKDVIKEQSEEVIFERIKEVIPKANLLPEEKWNLLVGLNKLKGVGPKAVAPLAVLTNKKGEKCPSAVLTNTNKEYLKHFAISLEDYDKSIDPFIVPENSIYSTFFKKENIEYIFTKENIIEIYKDYGAKWSSDFWVDIIDTLSCEDVLPIIHNAQPKIVQKFLDKIDKIVLNKDIYTDADIEYQYYKVPQNSEQTQTLLNKTYLDNELVSNYNISNDVTITIDQVPYKLQVCDLLPDRKTSIMQRFRELFPFVSVTLKELEQLQILKEIVETVKLKDVSPAQLVFISLINKTRNYTSYYPLSEDKVKNVNILLCLEYCFNHNIRLKLPQFNNSKGVNFNIQNKYFNHSKDVLLARELLPIEIQQWANNEEKKQFLFDLGVYKADNSVIKLRTDWLNGVDTNSNVSASEETLEWIHSKSSLLLHENAANRKERIALLRRLLVDNYERKNNTLCDKTAIAWNDNKRYLEWCAKKGVTIKVCPKGIPIELYHKDFTYCTVYEDSYLVHDKTIYISGISEAKDILKKVSASTSIFTIEDWYYMFSVSSDAYNDLQKEKESLKKRIEELERKLYELHAVSPTLGAGEDDNTSKQKQKEAQLEAQKYLLSMQRGIWEFPLGYGELNAEGELNCFSKFHVVDAEGNDMLIVLKSYKYKNEPFKINPIEWDSIMEESAHMFIYTGNDVVEIDKEEIVKNQTKIAVRFSAENLDVKEKIQEFSDLLHYFNDIHFDFESFNITKKAKSIREIYNKREGGQLDNSLGAI